ncbi:2-polyprenyl-6-methoxyphenol hydroxylase-like FAD-dependent oxidoreductase [Roseimicrobium gellanilyticum]|uniref:2-polyprenyl-6-methoxyphenol hydroxylase-like FAD-dependent oxidoreductase n=1 Tax=Roseimicrobium gellanilyticum TaxID=748857 RepID=A0A366HTN7_9BACT|nr:FAD-dependent monooxygenase [Roseimicrobium gellanilyticum]RBP46458.1 2-polyprenyl-6-methoxyphenol hydroxylase-like FAD-dependent oxidoreductase [Roseimicrobium gellanilyticum]
MADTPYSGTTPVGPPPRWSDAPPYTNLQRWTALAYGTLCHSFFIAAVVVMFVALHGGLTEGWSALSGWTGVAGNVLLLTQFAAGHSLLLGDRGRKWMARLAPFSLGRALSTTLFATISSLQLLLVFLWWSPSHVVWSAPAGWLLHVLDTLYAASWLLLAKSMYDAGMDVQIGLLGWRSVWRNEPAVYKPFARAGTFRYVRQPIYLSFALILWTAPVWTLDHLLAALLWTGYCIAAPVLKEKRYARYYGDAFVRYQQRVPYWLPLRRWRKEMATATEMDTPHDVIIIGAGPVGLLLANLLADRGRQVLVIEQNPDSQCPSQAIGITPPSLEIFSRLGLADALIASGVPISRVEVNGHYGPVGVCDFTHLSGPSKFVLSVPQSRTMALLRGNLARYPQARITHGAEAKLLAQDGSGVEVEVRNTNGRESVRAKHVVACDGSRGSTRNQLRIRTHEGKYPCHFVMADFMDSSGLGDEARLFFTADGAVESFPLPAGMRRWVIQMPDRQSSTAADLETLVQTVLHRTGIPLEMPHGVMPATLPFSPRWMRCETYVDGRIFLCGDSAHVMSPIGGQGMNTGFADAEFLSVALPAMQDDPAMASAWSSAYDRIRSRAARIATRRAAWGMRLGTLQGNVNALLRDTFMKAALFSPLLARPLALWFSMSSIPGATLSRVPSRRIPRRSRARRS